MCNERRWTIGLFLLALLSTHTSTIGAPPLPDGDPKFWTSYNRGLMAMREGRLPDAEKDLAAAIGLSPDPRVYLARAAALTLQQKFQEAMDDLSHANIPAQPGQRPGREPELWRTCIWAMSDIPMGDAESRGRGNDWFSGIPGHLIQGGDDFPTDYASFIAYEMAIPYRTARESQEDLNSPALREAMQKAGKWFANRALATGPMAAFNLQYAQQLLARNDWSGTLDAISLARAAYPFDADIRFVSAECYRRMGRPETARREYTVVLTMDTEMAAAYRGRALAAAAEGDEKRAQEDLRSAAKYEPKTIGDSEKVVSKLLAENSVKEPPATLLADLDAAASEPVEKLLPTAIKLQKSSAGSRVRYDEIYQDRLRQLTDATHEKNANAESFVALATYILDELPNRGEAVEPRRSTQYYRYQYSEAMEASRAIRTLGQALRINPDHVPALIRMAFAHDTLGQADQAQEYINQAMKRGGTENPDAVRLLAEYRARQIWNLKNRASRLRTPRFESSTHTENRSDGVYEVTVTTRYDPSPADLQNADAIERNAAALMAQAKSMMENAINSSPDSLGGMLLQASYQNWFGTGEESLKILKQAVEKYPNSLIAHDALINFLDTHGKTDQAVERRMIASKLYQTTAGPLLERIWDTISVNGWPALMSDVKRAREADPADARTTAYLAAALADAKKRDKSAAALRVAIAIELARLHLDDQGDGATLPRAAPDFALIIQLLRLSGERAAKDDHIDQAIADCRAACDFALRFDVGGKGDLMFSAMIPDPRAPRIPVPAPVNGATLAATTHVALGDIFKAQRKTREALGCFQAAAALARRQQSNIPQIGNAGGDTNFSEFANGPVVAYAWMELAKAHIALGNDEAALDALNNAGATQPDRKLAGEINKLMLQVTQRMNSR